MRLTIHPSAALLLGALVLHASPAAAAGTGATVAVADMDGSGHTDIVALDPDSRQVDVVWVNSGGDFRLTAQEFHDITDMSALAVADVNGDGKPDVVISDASGGGKGVRVLINRGDGTLAPDVAYAVGSGAGPVSVTLADVNGDGLLDVITANDEAGTVSVLLNNGDGSFSTSITVTIGGHPVAIAVGDLNGDGLPDLVVADVHNACVQLLINDGAGGFTVSVPQTVGTQPVALALADVDGDGNLDILVADQGDNTAAALMGHGDGSFEPATFYHTGASPGWIAAEDLTGTGRLDLVIDNYGDGSVSLLANTGHGFADQQQLFPAYGSYGTVVMSIGGTAQVVSPNVQAGQVQVTPAASAIRLGNAAHGSLRHIDGDQNPQSSSGRGGLNILSLSLLLAIGAWRRSSSR